jgi:formylglycine-generating enzyme required for sulfatase activity
MRAWAPGVAIVAVVMAASASAQTPLSATQERALAPRDHFQECAGCPELVVVPAGSFLMGSPANEKPREANETPERPSRSRPRNTASWIRTGSGDR